MDDLLVRKCFMGCQEASSSRLPDIFQEVTYIKSSLNNSQYINTKIYGNTGVIVDAKFNLLNVYGQPALIGSRSGNTRFMFPLYNNGFDFAVGSDHSFSGWRLNQDYTMSAVTVKNPSAANPSVMYIDNVAVASSDSNVNTFLDMYIFRYNYNGRPDTNKGEFRLYSMKIWNEEKTIENLKRDFVPCYIKVTGEVGLFDLVTHSFFGNSGTGSFGKGDDV